MNKSESCTEEPGWVEGTKAACCGAAQGPADRPPLLYWPNTKEETKKLYITAFFYSHFHMSI